jgi:hypothetical protein
MSGGLLRLSFEDVPSDAPRRWRRLVVVLLYGAYVSAVLAWWLAAEAVSARVSPLTWLIVQVLGFFGLVMALSMLFFANLAATRSIAEQKRTTLDERDAAAASAAYRPAWQLMSLYLLLGVLSVTVLRDVGRLQDGHLQTLFWSGLFLYLTLPTSIVAWTEPDPPAEDVAEAMVTAKEEYR